ncbi:TlpA family protein disulfide reductase [Lysobacter sp. TY2-98]|uniref:TlpA family protein disulfide reductase n=1 Tax=Lysobacter sp. TY2-98 TaxID=2290922 RepID=UPI000E20A32C|nr:TlpA disulfide reductase family protein [Lysobacter sp. TY2-98]AXK72666.1 TlpA family protein disulfide reductase [Lysobacter sp. TY2-98]
MRTRTVVIVAVLAGAIGVVASLATDPGWRTRLDQALDRIPASRAGQAVPAIDLPAPDGGRHTLSALAAGRPVLINLWASWCGPCLEEMPALDRFAKQQGANGVQVVGIALDDAAAVRAFLKAHPVSYPVLVDAAGPADTGVRLGNSRGVLPYSVLVGANGRVLRRWAGPLQAADLDDWAAEALRTRD